MARYDMKSYGNTSVADLVTVRRAKWACSGDADRLLAKGLVMPAAEDD